MTQRILVGDWVEQLRTLPDASVHMIGPTSPPYYGLRAYGTNPQVFGGEAGCEHDFEERRYYVEGGGTAGSSKEAFSQPGEANAARIKAARWRTDGVCACGAWRGELGSEPTPDLYVEHLVAGFRECRRVLRPDGVVVLNLGDSYAGSGKGPSNSMQRPASCLNDGQLRNGAAPTSWVSVPQGLKAKDLMMIPFRVAMALQQDGWYLRSVIPWVKRNAMPESVTDRPATAVEYLFLFSKARMYFWDAEAIRMLALNEGRLVKASGPDARNARVGDVVNDRRTAAGFTNHDTLVSGRSYRNSDAFFASWQGLLLDEDGDPLALVVNPAPLKEAHYASFPPKLVEPFVKAGTSERGCCSECGAPYRRVVERQTTWAERKALGGTAGNVGVSETYQNGVHGGRVDHNLHGPPPKTLGWQPTCAHDAEPRPCIILDPFLGAGTTLTVAAYFGRDGIGIELNPEYAALAGRRIRKAAAWERDISLDGELVPSRRPSPFAGLPLFDADIHEADEFLSSRKEHAE
jgi:DNA modification methylase